MYKNNNKYKIKINLRIGLDILNKKVLFLHNNL